MDVSDEIIIELLVNRFLITEEQAQQAREEAEANGQSAIDALVQLDLASEEQVMMVLSAEYGMDTFDFTDYKIPPETIEQVPGDIARRYRVVPVMRSGGALIVALADPTDLETLDSLRYILKTDVDAVIAPRSQIHQMLNRHYGNVEESVDDFLSDLTEGEVDMEEVTGSSFDPDESELTEDDAPIIRLVSLIIMEGFRLDSSDIHLEPLEKRFRVRYRIDGVLREVENPPKYLQNNIISRVKIMSRMDISEHRVPQDGRIRITAMGKELDLRVSCIPTTHGESIVMRILDKSSVQLGIPELGFFGDDDETIQNILRLPDGIFLVTGPTGSGKTTSLYAFLNTINQPSRKIITAEDPVEYELGGINQVQVNADIDFTFAKALRAMLRQAPNVIMVGEIRDLETAEIAINSALTGHLVFSTLHTNDAPTAVTRLMDMGVKPFLVASAVRAVMAQRLLRRVCKNCAEPTEPTEEELHFLKLDADYFAEADLKRGRGCSECNDGYKGRCGIFEIFLVEESIQQLIYDQVSSTVVREQARTLGMRTLREDGLRKVAAGMSTLEEVIRITATDEPM